MDQVFTVTLWRLSVDSLLRLSVVDYEENREAPHMSFAEVREKYDVDFWKFVAGKFLLELKLI